MTASDGPGWQTHRIKGIERPFFGYYARGVPFGPDDGTISPWATVASLALRPGDRAAGAPHWFHEIDLRIDRPYGFKASFNPTFADGVRQRTRLGVAVSFRTEPGADRPDDRELPVGTVLAA